MSTLKSDTLSNVAGTYSIGTERVARATAAAWVNFNSTGTVSIRAAYNVTSVTDNAVGSFTINFTSAFPDTNYAATFIANGEPSNNNTPIPSIHSTLSGSNYVDAAPTTSACSVAVITRGGAALDSDYIQLAFFR